MYFAGYSTYWSPAGILMASLGPCEKQREAFKLQADLLLPPAHSSPPLYRSHFALRTFLRAILILTRAAARHSSATRCRRCTLIFQKNAHCVHRPPSHPVVPPCSLSSPVFQAHLCNKKKAVEKKEEAEGIPRAYTTSCHSCELSTLTSPSPFVPDIAVATR